MLFLLKNGTYVDNIIWYFSCLSPTSSSPPTPLTLAAALPQATSGAERGRGHPDVECRAWTAWAEVGMCVVGGGFPRSIISGWLLCAEGGVGVLARRVHGRRLLGRGVGGQAGL